jgi:hypothetical protein
LFFFAVVFASCVIFSIFYWHVFHFVLLKRIRFQLFELRDEVRRIAAESNLGGNEHFRQLERFICKTIAYSPRISLPSFVLFSVFHQKEIVSDDATIQELRKFEVEAPSSFILIRNSTAKFSLIIMALNSPWMVVFSSMFTVALLALGKISRMSLFQAAEKFVENIESNPDGCLQPA